MSMVTSNSASLNEAPTYEDARQLKKEAFKVSKIWV